MIRFLSLLAASVCAAVGVMVEFHDTTSVETVNLGFDGISFFTDSDTFPRTGIKVITFETGSQNDDIDIAAGGQKGTNTDELLKMSADARILFPDSRGILLIDDGRNTLREDGTRSYTYHMVYLILSNTRRYYATYSGYFEEGENEITINFARVIKPDGETVELAPGDIKIQTPPSQGSLFFGRGKIITFTLPGVEIGDIVEYSYEDITLNPWNKEIFEAGYYFQADDPYIFSRLAIDVPEDEPIMWKGYNMPEESSQPKIEENDGRKTYTWLCENVAPYVPEPYAPPSGDFLSRVEVTNQSTWDKLYDWYAGFQLERMGITPRIQELADSLSSGVLPSQDKVASIYHWMQTDIRYISVKGAAGSGVSGHPASFTLERGFGDCTDKSILFSTLLRASGIEAYPVYVGTNLSVPLLDPALPQYYGNHCITEVYLGDSSIYLDATGSQDGGYSRYPSFSSADHGIYAVNAQKRKVEVIPVPAPEQQLQKYKIEAEADTEGNLTVHTEMSFLGLSEAGWRASVRRQCRMR